MGERSKERERAEGQGCGWMGREGRCEGRWVERREGKEEKGSERGSGRKREGEGEEEEQGGERRRGRKWREV